MEGSEVQPHIKLAKGIIIQPSNAIKVRNS